MEKRAVISKSARTNNSFKTKSYSDKLKDPRWQKKRLEILNRDEFKCVKCGDDKTELHVHHKQYQGEPWEAKNINLETICKHCHIFIHKSTFKVEGDFYAIKTYDSILNIDLYILIQRNGIIVFTINEDDIELISALSIDNLNRASNRYQEILKKHSK